MSPYISVGGRVQLDDSINEILEIIHGEGNVDGDVNYVISRIVAGSFKPAGGWRYAALARAIAVLECAKLELYRRLAAPYEDGAIDKNGDIPEYDT